MSSANKTGYPLSLRLVEINSGTTVPLAGADPGILSGAPKIQVRCNLHTDKQTLGI